MKYGTAAALLFAACWRGNEPTVARPAPPREQARRVAPPRAVDPVALAQALRTDPHRVLADDGPIVVLYFDSDVIDTLCGPRAREAQHAWGELFADPSRGEPLCRKTDDGIHCAQRSPSIVSVTFATTPRLRPVSAVLGSAAGHGSIAAVRKHLDTIETARCP